MYQAGIPVRDIALETGLGKHTIYNILSGAYKWGEILENSDSYHRYKAATTKSIEVNCWELAKKSFIHAEEKLPDASYAQAVLGGSILLDKARLLAGQATSIIEHVNRAEWQDEDDLLRRLAASIIDVTPEGAP